MVTKETHAIMEKMLGMVFSEWPMSRPYNKGHLPVEHKINEDKPQAISFSHRLLPPDAHLACKIYRYNL
jgi:hypothetical protein